MPDSPTNRDEINVHGRPVGSAVGGGRVQARNIAGGDIHEHTHYPAAEVTFPLIHLPPANPNFTGREKELTAIENALHHDENTLAITQAITGLGGVGKTQLALAYAHAHRDDYALIWQLRADEAATLDGDLRQLGAALNLPLADKDAATARAMTLARLNGMDEKWLLIYDNADALAPRELRPYLPGGRGHRLITTRRARWQGAQTLRLGVFSVDEAMDFWQRRLAQRFVKSAGFDKSWADLAAELGRLPLALEQAAAYMVARGKTASDYLRLYRQQRAALWDRQPPPEDYDATVTTTWEMAFEYARQTPGAAALLNLCCFLAPEEIPLEVIITHAGALPEDLAAVLADELARDDAVAALTTYSLMTQADGKLSLHRLVAAVARERMGAERATMWAEAAVNLLRRAYRFDQHDMTTWAKCGQLLPHLMAAIELAEKWGIETNEAASLNNSTGLYLSQFGDNAGARPYVERALAIREKALEADPQNEAMLRSTATSLNNLGLLLKTMGDYEGARPYYERALAILEKALEADPQNEAMLRSTATSLNNLGGLLDSMGDYEGARPYVERALAIREKALGPDHPDTANSLNNLGALLDSMGDLEGARPYYERALAIREKALGPDHPDTATSLNNLGYLLQAMGDYEGARPYYERALAINEKALGPDHPTTAASLNNLGGLLQAMGDLAGARPYVERALAIKEKALGPDPQNEAMLRSTATSLNNLAILSYYQKDFPEAARLMRRAYAIWQNALGDNHPQTQSARQTLSVIESAL